MHRANRETAAALRDLLGRWDDVGDHVAAWLAENADSRVADFAQQLCAEFAAWYAYSFEDEPFLQDLVQAGLARIDWPTVARTLLAHAARQQLRCQTCAIANLLRRRSIS